MHDDVLARVRRDLILQLASSIGRPGILVVSGPPGVGKTSLLLSALRERHADAPRTAVAEVDLGPVGSVAAALARVAHVLGVPAEMSTSSWTTLAQSAADAGQAILIVYGAGSDKSLLEALVEAMSAPARGITLVIVSPWRLRHAQATNFEVPPLDLESTVTLLRTKLQAAGRSGARGAWTDEALRRIAERLDGLPLAIDLVVTAARVMTAPQVESRLRESLDVLSDGETSLAELYATAITSLHSTAQSLLASLALFADTFTIDEVELVAELSPGEVRVGLMQLADAHIVQETRDGFAMRLLHGAREHVLAAARRSTAGDPTSYEHSIAKRRRHAQAIVMHVESLGRRASSDAGTDALDHLGRLVPEVEAILAAGDAIDVETCARGVLALEPLALARGPLGEHLDRLRACRRRIEGIRGPLQGTSAAACAALDSLEGRLLAQIGVASFLRAELLDAATALATAHRIAVQQGAHDYAAEASAVLVLALQWRGEHGPDESPTPGGALGALALAVLALHRGDLEGCLRRTEDGIARARDSGERREEGRLLGLHGVANHELGQYVIADEEIRRAHEMLESAGDAHFAAVARMWRALVWLEWRRSESVEREFIEIERELRRVGDGFFVGAARGYLGVALLVRGDAEGASTALSEAVALARRDRDAYRTGLFAPAMAMACAELGDLGSARSLLDEARKLLSRPVNPTLPFLFEVASVVVDLHDPRERDAARQRAVSLWRTMHSPVPAESGAAERRGRSSDLRILLAIFERTLRRDEIDLDAPMTVESTLRVDERGFRIDERIPVDLTRRRNLLNLLRHLDVRARESPGTPVPTDELFTAGWPGVRCMEGAAAHRVHVALATLRNMGLAPFLVRTRGGYHLQRRAPTNGGGTAA